MSDKGFTMIEMLLVLLLVSICFALFPFVHAPKEALMNLHMEQVRQTLLEIQAQALFEKREIMVHLGGDTLYADDVSYALPAACYGDVIFHANGNVNHAMSIPCSWSHERRTLVIQLGAGRIYAK